MQIITCERGSETETVEEKTAAIAGQKYQLEPTNSHNNFADFCH